MSMLDFWLVIAVLCLAAGVAFGVYEEYQKERTYTEVYKEHAAGTYLEYVNPFGKLVVVRIRACEFKDYGHGVIGYVTYDEGVHVLLHAEYWQIFTVSNNEVPSDEV